MDIKDIKKEFPIFDNKVHNNDLVYLDSANSSQKPKVVVLSLIHTDAADEHRRGLVGGGGGVG